MNQSWPATNGCGVNAARDLARARRGTQFDPALADLLDDDAEAILSGLASAAGAWEPVIEASRSGHAGRFTRLALKNEWRGSLQSGMMPLNGTRLW